MREVRGFDPHTERMLNTRDDRLEPISQHRTAKPTLLLHPDQHSLAAIGMDFFVRPDHSLAAIRMDFFAPQHTCAGQFGVGSLLTVYIACTLRHQVGRDNLSIKG